MAAQHREAGARDRQGDVKHFKFDVGDRVVHHYTGAKAVVTGCFWDKRGRRRIPMYHITFDEDPCPPCGIQAQARSEKWLELEVPESTRSGTTGRRGS